MPTYDLKNTETSEVESHYFKSWKDRDKFLDLNPHYVVSLTTPPLISDHMTTLRRAGHGWQDMLKSIKKSSGRNNTIRD